MDIRLLRYLTSHLILTLILGSTLVCVGCHGSDGEELLDARELLNKYELDRRRHDPKNFSEIDLGKFAITKRRDADIFHIRFQLFAVVPDKNIEQFNTSIATHGERMRAKVREAVQGTNEENLHDPTLGWLKSELITSINASLETRILRDVVFTDFSYEPG